MRTVYKKKRIVKSISELGHLHYIRLVDTKSCYT